MASELVLDSFAKIAVSVISTVAVAAITLLFKSVRNFIFYRRAEYDLIAQRKFRESPFRRQWSINWENNRLDLEAGDISNNEITEVSFKNAVGKVHSEKTMHPSDRFIDMFDGALGVKVDSIVRLNRPSDSDLAIYTLRLVIRRKRWK